MNNLLAGMKDTTALWSLSKESETGLSEFCTRGEKAETFDVFQAQPYFKG